MTATVKQNLSASLEGETFLRDDDASTAIESDIDNDLIAMEHHNGRKQSDKAERPRLRPAQPAARDLLLRSPPPTHDSEQGAQHRGSRIVSLVRSIFHIPKIPFVSGKESERLSRDDGDDETTGSTQNTTRRVSGIASQVRSTMTQSILVVPFRRPGSRKDKRRYPLRRSIAQPASSREWHQNLSFRGLYEGASTASALDATNESTCCRIHKQSLIEVSTWLLCHGKEWIGGVLVLLLWSVPGRVLTRVWGPIHRFLTRLFLGIAAHVPLPQNANKHFLQFSGWFQHETHRVSTGVGRKKYVYASGAALWGVRQTILKSSTVKPPGRPLLRRRGRSQRERG